MYNGTEMNGTQDPNKWYTRGIPNEWTECQRHEGRSTRVPYTRAVVYTNVIRPKYTTMPEHWNNAQWNEDEPNPIPSAVVQESTLLSKGQISSCRGHWNNKPKMQTSWRCGRTEPLNQTSFPRAGPSETRIGCTKWIDPNMGVVVSCCGSIRTLWQRRCNSQRQRRDSTERSCLEPKGV